MSCSRRMNDGDSSNYLKRSSYDKNWNVSVTADYSAGTKPKTKTKNASQIVSSKYGVTQNNAQNIIMSDEVFSRISDKIYNAYQCLNPTVNEMMGNIFALTKNRLTRDSSIYSLTQEQYQCVIKASQLAQEVNKELGKQDTDYLYLLKWKIRHFPAPDLGATTPVYSATSSKTSASRIYIEKNLVDQLVQLHKLLCKALQVLYKVAKRKENNPDGKTKKRSSNTARSPSKSRKQTSKTSDSSYADDLAKLQDEYDDLNNTLSVLKGILRCTLGSIDDVRKLTIGQCSTTTKSMNSLNEPVVSHKVTDVSGARRCILECLSELAEVRRYLKNDNVEEDIDMLNQIELSTHSATCCSRDDVPHLHATLNGIPIVLKLSKDAISTLLTSSISNTNNFNTTGNISTSNQDVKLKNNKANSKAWTIANLLEIIYSDENSNSKLNRNSVVERGNQAIEKLSMKSTNSMKSPEKETDESDKSPSSSESHQDCNSSQSTINLISDNFVNSESSNAIIVKPSNQLISITPLNENKSESSSSGETMLSTTTDVMTTDEDNENREKFEYRLAGGYSGKIKVRRRLFGNLPCIAEIERKHQLSENGLERGSSPLEIKRESTDLHKDKESSLPKRFVQNISSSETTHNRNFHLDSESHNSTTKVLATQKSDLCKLKVNKAEVALSIVQSSATNMNKSKSSTETHRRKITIRVIRSHSKFVVSNSRLKHKRGGRQKGAFQKELEELNVRGVPNVSSSTECCRNSKSMRKFNCSLPYSPSLTSLPLDCTDIAIIKKRMAENSRPKRKKCHKMEVNGNSNEDVPPEGKLKIREISKQCFQEAKYASLTRLMELCNKREVTTSSHQFLPSNSQTFEVRMLKYSNKDVSNSHKELNSSHSKHVDGRSRCYSYSDGISSGLKQSLSTYFLRHHRHDQNQVTVNAWKSPSATDASLPHINIARSLSDTTMLSMTVLKSNHQLLTSPLTARPINLQGSSNIGRTDDNAVAPVNSPSNRTKRDKERSRQNSSKTLRNIGLNPIGCQYENFFSRSSKLFSLEDIYRNRQLFSTLLFPLEQSEDSGNDLKDELPQKGPRTRVDASTSYHKSKNRKLKERYMLEAENKSNGNRDDNNELPEKRKNDVPSTAKYANRLRKSKMEKPLGEVNDVNDQKIQDCERLRVTRSKTLETCKSPTENRSSNQQGAANNLEEHDNPSAPNRPVRKSKIPPAEPNQAASTCCNKDVNVKHHSIKHCKQVCPRHNKAMTVFPSFTSKYAQKISTKNESYNLVNRGTQLHSRQSWETETKQCNCHDCKLKRSLKENRNSRSETPYQHKPGIMDCHHGERCIRECHHHDHGKHPKKRFKLSSSDSSEILHFDDVATDHIHGDRNRNENTDETEATVKRRKCSHKSTQWPPVVYRNKMCTVPQNLNTKIKTKRSYNTNKCHRIEEHSVIEGCTQTENTGLNLMFSATYLTNIKSVRGTKDRAKILDRKFILRDIDFIIKEAIEAISRPSLMLLREKAASKQFKSGRGMNLDNTLRGPLNYIKRLRNKKYFVDNKRDRRLKN